MEFEDRPILFKYTPPESPFLSKIASGSPAAELQEQERVIVENHHYKNHIRGSFPKVYVRAAVLDRLQQALSTLAPEYGYVIYDAYRSKETQTGLFDAYFQSIKEANPSWSSAQLHAEIRKFVAHPDEPSRFEVPPHNSGGAIDLALTYQGERVFMGTEFDDLTEKAATDFFEKPFSSGFGITEAEWNMARVNRRLLFHSMCGAGFTNWKYEWWHFDLGNCLWSQELGVDWIFDSMDSFNP